MSVVGIDFGDDYLTIACARRAGIDVLQNEIGKRKTRAGFSLHRVHRHIGDEFQNQFQSNTANCLIFLKRLLGKQYDDPDVEYEKKYMYVKLDKDDDGRVVIVGEHLGKEVRLTPEQCVAVLLKQLAETYRINNDIGSKMKDCVISVPAYFSDTQRRSMMTAAKIANLNVLRLINDTTAIALQYGTGRTIGDNEIRRIIFYDMGIGSTTVALVQIEKNRLKVEKISYDHRLGGREFDEQLAEYLNEDFKKRYKIDAYTTFRSQVKLRKECDRIKQVLSANTRVPYTIEYLLHGIDVSGVITREEFEKLVEAKYHDRILAPQKEVTKDINLQDIHSLELLGGSTRIPIIQNILRDYFGRDLSKTCDSDESICRGATLQCAMISPSFKVRDYEVKDIVPYTQLARISYDTNEKSINNEKILKPDTIHKEVTYIKKFETIPCHRSVYACKDIKKQPFYFEQGYNKDETSQYSSLPETCVARAMINYKEPINIDDIQHILVRCCVDASGLTRIDGADLVTNDTIEEDVPLTPEELQEQQKNDATNDTTKNTTENVMTDDNEATKQKETMTDDTNSTKQQQQQQQPEPIKTKKVMKTYQRRYPCEIIKYYPGKLSKASLQKAIEQENDMSVSDRIVKETHAARNTFEGYILTNRSRIQDTSDLGKYIQSDKITPLVDLCNKEELWLEDEGYNAKKVQFEEHLENLKTVFEPVIQRAKDWEDKQENFNKMKKDYESKIQEQKNNQYIVQNTIQDAYQAIETITNQVSSYFTKPRYNSCELTDEIYIQIQKTLKDKISHIEEGIRNAKQAADQQNEEAAKAKAEASNSTEAAKGPTSTTDDVNAKNIPPNTEAEKATQEA